MIGTARHERGAELVLALGTLMFVHTLQFDARLEAPVHAYAGSGAKSSL